MRRPEGGDAIRVRGLVQGVGFRPGVWRLAAAHGLAGEVWNDAEGVEIRVWGQAAARRLFLQGIPEAVPLARIDAIEVRPLPGAAPHQGFQIVESLGGRVRASLVPDAATCDECLRELRDRSARRYRYPFTNCTRCGPRLTIARALPYDRARTSMAAFVMCDACRGEYANPADRRFHAQPIACPACGPRLSLSVEEAGNAIVKGGIVAIKGLGGWQLAVDALNERAVARLRARKRRYAKPFALMALDVLTVEKYCSASSDEHELLRHPAAPIVLLPRKTADGIAHSVAPGCRTLGFMLPTTPLHHLLLEGLDRPLVMTSGNVSDEPQCVDDEDARARLTGVADAFLGHDRPIVNRVDDSVARIIDGAPCIVRRARGYAPAPIPLPPGFGDAPSLLAMGADLKNTFCLLEHGRATLSQHIGDLGEPRTRADYRRNLGLYRKFHEHRPQIVAVDRHPDYFSSRSGRELDVEEVVEVQHHHAHIAACLAENGVPLHAPPVLGIALDGLGYGEEGTLWGGEFLLADYRGFRRLAHFPAVPLPGGDRAAREPWRNTAAHLAPFMDQDKYSELDVVKFLGERNWRTFTDSAPIRSSSCGRLFDAVAGALGVCWEGTSYEGQAAIELEHLADPQEQGAYRFTVKGLEFWPSLLEDLLEGTARGTIAARFHNGLADAIREKVGELSGFDTVVLTGGCFQNAWLLARLSRALRKQGLNVLTHSRVPANDGGIALGQAAVAAARSLACA